MRDGVALAYTEAGSGAPPLLLVLVRGWTIRTWPPQFDCSVAPIASSRSIASDKPVQEYTVAGFADDLAWLCDQLRVDKPVVVGHSMGGNVAFELARRDPDLPAAVVALDSAIVRPDWLVPEARQHAAGLRGPDYQEVQRRYAEEFFLPTDDAHLKAAHRRFVVAPAACDAVCLGAAPAGLGRGGGGRGLPGASAPHQFRDAAVRHLPLPGADPAAGYRPNRGRTFHHPVRSRAGQRHDRAFPRHIAARPGVSPPNRDSAKHALATDQELWKARSFPEPNAARGRPRWEPTGEPFRRAVPQTGPPF
jgi:pimeloyl-ACP methyl ester carboxylesterase